MNPGYRPIERCRLCGGGELVRHIDFGDVPLGNNLQEDQAAARSAAAYPLLLNRCSTCSHFQLGHAVAPHLLYATNYTYLSGIGTSFVRHFKEYAEWVDAVCNLDSNALVVDIGSNDGTCLKAFQERGYRVCGVDPASLAAGIANDNGVETINAFFGLDSANEIATRHGQADFITSHNVLAHVDDLADVFRNIYALLKDGGYFAFEVGYFRDVLRTGCFDTIYHEHLDYHHASPLARHLTEIGFDLHSMSVNNVQGGSLRLLLRKTGKGHILPAAHEFLAEEARSVLYDDTFLSSWKQGVETQMSALKIELRRHIDRGAVIVAYGAPTKATLLMQVAGLGADEIAFVVEDNAHKVGRFLPGTGVPIRPTAELTSSHPDVVVIFAWNFADDIIRKLQDSFETPLDVIVPLPELRSMSL